MSNYTFETMSQADATAFTSADSLAFSSSGVSGSSVQVLYDSAQGSATLIVGGKSLTFSVAAISGAHSAGSVPSGTYSFADGSELFVGTTTAGAGDSFTGGDGGDGAYGLTGDDTMSGGAGDDFIQGNKGADRITGGDGADTLYGGQDSDILDGGVGANFLQGNLGDDTLSVSAGATAASTLYGGQGNDTVFGGGGGDLIFGDLGDDSLSGGSGGDSITGGNGADIIVGGAGKDIMVGGAGADRFVFHGGDSSLTGGLGDQILDWSASDVLDLGVAGTAANFTQLSADSYADALTAATARIGDVIKTVAVQVGADVVVFTAMSGSSPTEAIVLVGRSLTDITFSNIVNVDGGDPIQGPTSGDDVLVGGADDDTISGLAGNDTISGLGGNDLLIGGPGNDLLGGGAGSDTASFNDGVSGGVTVSLVTQVADGHGHDTLVSIENVTGGDGADSITGDGSANVLNGGAGSDTLAGGNDDDRLIGGAGDDIIDGGGGVDTLSFQDGLSGGVLVDLPGGKAYNHGTDTLVSIENVDGSNGDDDLFGDAQNNLLVGNAGDDMFDGGAGADTLVGGAGDDTFKVYDAGAKVVSGGDGVDSIYFNAPLPAGVHIAGPGVTIDLALTTAQQVDATRTVTLSSIENFRGSVDNDTVSASNETNILESSGGADHFVFRSLAELGLGASADYIQLQAGCVIDVSQIDADTTQPGNQAFHILWTDAVATASFTGHPGEIAQSYDSAKVMYRLDFDVNGDGVSDATLWITPTAHLNAASFNL